VFWPQQTQFLVVRFSLRVFEKSKLQSLFWRNITLCILLFGDEVRLDEFFHKHLWGKRS
jgi:hypothetical protein